MQAPLDEGGKGDQEIGGVAVVEADAHVLVAGNRIEELVEALSRDPIAFLVGLQLARGRADPVETEVDDLHPVRPDVTVSYSSSSRRLARSHEYSRSMNARPDSPS